MQFHEEADVGKYCTLSMVKRWGFVISEHISINAGVELIKGRHVPDDEEPAFSEIDDSKSSITVNSSSAASDITDPIKHRRDASTPSLYSDAVSNARGHSGASAASSIADYPPLAIKKIKAKHEQKHEESASQSEESGTGKTVFNAWLRERQLPREPSEASLSFSSMASGKYLL